MIFTDTFDRADNLSSLGSPWTTHAGPFGVVSSDGRYTGDLTYPGKSDWPGGADPTAMKAATVDVGTADMIVEWDATPASGHRYLLFRYTDPSNTLAVLASSSVPDTMLLRGGGGTIASAYSPGWQTKRIKVTTLGTKVRVYADDVLTIDAVTSANLTATRAGIGGNAIGWDPLSFSDSFTRSDASSLGSPWTVTGGTWGIASNRARWLSGTGIGEAIVDLGSPVQTVEWTWSALAKGPSRQIFRYLSHSDYWFVSGTVSDGNKMYLISRAGGIVATATGVTWGPGSTLRVEAGESDIRVYSAGTLIITHTVSSAVTPGGGAGIGGNMDDPLLPNTRWASFSGAGSDTDSLLSPGGSVGPWLNDVHWNRFHCGPVSPARRPRTSVGVLVARA